jgi:hypothetical protein
MVGLVAHGDAAVRRVGEHHRERALGERVATRAGARVHRNTPPPNAPEAPEYSGSARGGAKSGLGGGQKAPNCPRTPPNAPGLFDSAKRTHRDLAGRRRWGKKVREGAGRCRKAQRKRDLAKRTHGGATRRQGDKATRRQGDRACENELSAARPSPHWMARRSVVVQPGATPCNAMQPNQAIRQNEATASRRASVPAVPAVPACLRASSPPLPRARARITFITTL